MFWDEHFIDTFLLTSHFHVRGEQPDDDDGSGTDEDDDVGMLRYEG